MPHSKWCDIAKLKSFPGVWVWVILSRLAGILLALSRLEVMHRRVGKGLIWLFVGSVDKGDESKYVKRSYPVGNRPLHIEQLSRSRNSHRLKHWLAHLTPVKSSSPVRYLRGLDRTSTKKVQRIENSFFMGLRVDQTAVEITSTQAKPGWCAGWRSSSVRGGGHCLCRRGFNRRLFFSATIRKR